MHEGEAGQCGGSGVRRDVGAGRDAVEPEKLIKNAQLECRVQVAMRGGPEKADDERALQQGGVYSETERGKKDKKKATLKTCNKMSA